MASEPAEAAFARPPVLSTEQEEEYRQLDREGEIDVPLSRSTTIGRQTSHPIAELERSYTKQGIHIVQFEKGKGEDPREWSKGRKW